MFMTTISEYQLEKLLKCRKTKLRGFKEWNTESLINEAISEFYERYGKE